jgi:hypothetical protein
MTTDDPIWRAFAGRADYLEGLGQTTGIPIPDVSEIQW